MSLKYRCLVLDHDDTVVNSTATVHYPCFVEYMEKYQPQVHLTLEEYFRYNFDPGVVPMFLDICGLSRDSLAHEEAYWKEYVKYHIPKAYPGIRIAGTYSPSYGFEKNPEEVEVINTMLRESHADILILGVGVPKQEIFGYQNQEKYNIPVTINAGATIDFLAGNKKRAPKWMVDSGLEWLYRTIKEPKRVGGRVLRDLAIFPLAWKYRPRK